MIHRIYSNKESFKSVEFKKGLNIILADKTSNSGDKDTRNGAGKTTLINIINFCLGGELNSEILPVEEIRDWEFTIELDLNLALIKATRSIENSNIINIEGDFSKLPKPPENNTSSNQYFYKNDSWKQILANCLFGLENDLSEKYKPSFRSLISYFIRAKADAYIDPFCYFRNQPSWSKQVNNAFLLGLNWRLASSGQEIEDKRKALLALEVSMKCGIRPTKGELEANRVQLANEIEKENIALTSFKVLPQYEELQRKADSLTRSIHTSLDKSLILKQKLNQYKEAVSFEKAPDKESVEKLYAEAGLFFSDSLKKTLEEVKSFHEKIVHNRKEFLQVEIDQIEHKIEDEEENIKINSEKRSSMMELLKNHGALDEFTKLQNRLLEKQQKLESINNKLNEIKQISDDKKRIKRKKIELESKLQRDYELTRSNWEQAIMIFSENSKALYDLSGNLIINTTDIGYKFDVDIHKSNSEGVSKMKIFCYDFMLLQLFNIRHKINFLIHDSTLYDGVDSRQRALALDHAKRKSEEHGMQYICALNSDMLPYEDLANLIDDIDPYICLTLEDKTPEDSILGFHFETKAKLT